jgi:hypothetical protein
MDADDTGDVAAALQRAGWHQHHIESDIAEHDGAGAASPP